MLNMQGSKETQVPACLLDKELSKFAFLGQDLADAVTCLGPYQTSENETLLAQKENLLVPDYRMVNTCMKNF